jgi:hypothetical protein
MDGCRDRGRTLRRRCFAKPLGELVGYSPGTREAYSRGVLRGVPQVPMWMAEAETLLGENFLLILKLSYRALQQLCRHNMAAKVRVESSEYGVVRTRSLTHALTHTRTHAHTHTPMHIRAHTRRHTRPLSRTHTRAHAHPCSHARAHAHRYARARAGGDGEARAAHAVAPRLEARPGSARPCLSTSATGTEWAHPSGNYDHALVCATLVCLCVCVVCVCVCARACAYLCVRVDY